MTRFRPTPSSTALLITALVALVLLLTGTLVPRFVSALVFAVAAFLWFRSGTRERDED